MTKIKNKTVLITGGASGIGKLMSRLSLARKAKVIIWDINTENIASTLKELSSLGDISAYVVDVSKLEAIEEAAQQLIKKHVNIDIIINNAGIVVGKYFHEHSAKEIEKTHHFFWGFFFYLLSLGNVRIKKQNHTYYRRSFWNW